MTDTYLTVAEVKERYPNEWVLLDRLRVNRRREVLGGHLLCHSGDRIEFDRLMAAVPPSTNGPRQFATFYTGEHRFEEDVVEETEPHELRRAQ